MLGPDQRRWFEDVVTHSDATWKVVVSSVPISVPTGGGGSAGHDGWANFDLDVGFERELASIWRAFRDAGTKNVVFVTTDVHFATGFTYHPFPESPDFTIHELTGGPLSAKFLPNRDVDPSFNPERLYFFGPEATPNTFEDAMGFMNWVHIAIDEAGKFSYSVRNALGREVASGVLPTRR
jgi:alkaline phosphatase D